MSFLIAIDIVSYYINSYFGGVFMNLNKTIGFNIRFLRTQRDLSMEELAEMLNISTAFVGLIERGQRGASVKNLLKLSKIFNIQVDYFLNNEIFEANEKNNYDTLYSLMYDLEFEKINFLIAIVRELKKI